MHQCILFPQVIDPAIRLNPIFLHKCYTLGLRKLSNKRRIQLAQIDAQIAVQALSKTYRVPVRNEGLGAAFKSLWHRKYREIAAVQDVSFQIDPGEMVGLLGANGAGKTTLLKLLAGLLYPSEGTVSVAGFVPWQRRPDYL